MYRLILSVLILLISNHSVADKQIVGFFDRDVQFTCGVAAIVGGALGAAVKDNNREKGALYGAVIAGGACVAIKYYTKKKKSSNQVAKEYFKKYKSLPATTKVKVYQINTSSQAIVKRGGTLTINSFINVVQGSKVKTLKIVESLFIFNSKTGELVDHYNRPVNSNQSGGGEYENTYTMKVDKNIRPGLYDVRTVLSINDHHTKSNDVTITVI